MNLPWVDGLTLILKAIEKAQEERDWDLYASVYPKMNKETFVTFEKFRKLIRPEVTKVKMTDEEILNQAEELKAIHQGKHEGTNPKILTEKELRELGII